MGHADIATTMIYVHHVPQHDAADRLSARLSEGIDRRRGARPGRRRGQRGDVAIRPLRSPGLPWRRPGAAWGLVSAGRRANIDVVAREREEDRGLSANNAGLLNEHFYEGRPWAYFRRRLVHLAMTADPDARLVPAGGLTLTVGKAQIRLDLHDAESDREADVSPIANTRFVAAEGEVLLHHTSETLLRLALAHLPTADGATPAAPWLALSRERSVEAFKTRVRREFLDDDDIEVRRATMELLFARHPGSDDERAEQRLDELGRYVAYLARVFLDADAYNAAKHGFALRGERSSLDVSVDDLSVVEASGYSFEMLHAVPDPRGRRRWRLTERWYSIDVTAALIWLATALIENLWAVARRRYLGAQLPVVFTPPPLNDLLDLEDGDPRRLVEMYSTLRYHDAAPARS